VNFNESKQTTLLELAKGHKAHCLGRKKSPDRIVSSKMKSLADSRSHGPSDKGGDDEVSSSDGQQHQGGTGTTAATDRQQQLARTNEWNTIRRTRATMGITLLVLLLAIFATILILASRYDQQQFQLTVRSFIMR
jgi:hypothetical protein